MRAYDPNAVAVEANLRQLSNQAFQSAYWLSALARGTPPEIDRKFGKAVLNSLKVFLSHSQAADIANRIARRANA